MRPIQWLAAKIIVAPTRNPKFSRWRGRSRRPQDRTLWTRWSYDSSWQNQPQVNWLEQLRWGLQHEENHLEVLEQNLEEASAPRFLLDYVPTRPRFSTTNSEVWLGSFANDLKRILSALGVTPRCSCRNPALTIAAEGLGSTRFHATSPGSARLGFASFQKPPRDEQRS